MKKPPYYDSALALPARKTLKAALDLLGDVGEQLLLVKMGSDTRRTAPKLQIKNTDKAVRQALSKHCVFITTELSAMFDQASDPEKQSIRDLGVFLRKCCKVQFKTLTAVQRKDLASALDKIDPPSPARD
jgi:hypothetical protein